jgi:hypothetical protein
MRVEQLVTCIKEAIKHDAPLMIHGSPGIGKSAIVHQVAEDLNLNILDYRLSQIDAVDLRGVPSINNGRTHWNAPAEFPNEGKGLLFLDEINSAPQAVQAAAYQLVLDRSLGTYTLPKGWIPIAAGNRVTDRAIVNQMPTPLRNRFIHFDLESSIDDWSAWATTAGIPEQVIAFLRFRPNLLDEFATDDSAKKIKDAQAFCTPRSWAMASRFVNTPSHRLAMMSSAVGAGPAAEFESYLRVYDELMDLDELLKNPKIYKEPKNPGAQYAIATGIAARVQDNDKVFGNFFKVIEQMPVDFATLAVKDAERRNKKIIDAPVFISWASKYLPMFLPK